MLQIPTADLLAGEEVLAAKQQLELNDPIFDASLRPDLNSALGRISGLVGGFRVPFASGGFDHHADIPEQNLFRCLFGRDSLIISSLLQKFDPDLTLQTVCALAKHQGAKFDSASEEEPGRIPHEVRDVDDPQALKIATEAGWSFPYYGSVDATLLWLIALDQLSQADESILEIEIDGQNLDGRAQLATDWMLRRIESGGGVIRSERSNPRGILNQVWKDSGDSFMTDLGEVATESGTAAVETVGDTFDALVAASNLATRSKVSWRVTPNQLLEKAREIRARLIEKWWLGDRFAMGLGKIHGKETVLGALASNQWRLLDSEILLDPAYSEYSRILIESVTDPDILGPSGLRTLSKSHPRYRPGGYHTGSSWPMDAALVARGLLKHGATLEARELGAKTVSAIEAVGGYPEFFRSDETEKANLTRYVIDVWDPVIGAPNRICQPPQLLQGWSIAAYQWFKQSGIESRP